MFTYIHTTYIHTYIHHSIVKIAGTAAHDQRTMAISSPRSPTRQCHRLEIKGAVANHQCNSFGLKPKLSHNTCAKGRSAKGTEGAYPTLNDSSPL